MNEFAPTVSLLLRRARMEAGLTQAQLAARLGSTQPELARLERAGSNPTIATVDRVLRAAGRRLQLTAPAWQGTVDETLISAQLKMTPADRIREAEQLYREARRLAQMGHRARGRLS
jgi:transcriptional regulator with XRE-family HTH domain